MSNKYPYEVVMSAHYSIINDKSEYKFPYQTYSEAYDELKKVAAHLEAHIFNSKNHFTEICCKIVETETNKTLEAFEFKSFGEKKE